MNKVCYKPAPTGWSYKYDCCVACGLNDSPHKAHGICSRCAARKRARFNKGTLGKHCVICQEARAIDLCHIVPQRLGGPDDGWNILYLCATHHRCFDQDTLYDAEWAPIRAKVEAAIGRFGAKVGGQWGHQGWPRVLRRLA